MSSYRRVKWKGLRGSSGGLFPPRSYREFFVDATNGNDANPGTSRGQPWQTIAQVNGETFRPTDRILFKRGETWREALALPSSGIAGSPITVDAYGSGALPIINGADIITGWALEGGTPNVWEAALATEPNQVFFDETKGTLEAAVINLDAAGEWFWAANVLYVYSLAGDPDDEFTSPGIEASVRNWCVRIDTKDYITLKNLLARYGNWNGNIDIEDSAYFTFTGLGVEWSVKNGIYIENCTNGKILGGHTHDNGTNIVGVDLGAGVLITGNASQDNTVQSLETNNNLEDGVAIGGAPGQYPGDDNNVLDCYSHNNHEDGFDIKGGTSRFEGNIAADNGRIGFKLNENANGIMLYRNWIENCGTLGIQLISENNHQVINNVIFDSGDYGISAETGTGHQILSNTLYVNSGFADLIVRTDDTVVKNNAIYSNGVRSFRTTAVAGLDEDYNRFYRVDGGAVDVVRIDAAVYTLADLNDGTYTAAETQGANTRGADPVFVTNGSDFHLQAGSPCIGNGVNLGTTTDYDGVTRGDPPDIGAYEYVP